MKKYLFLTALLIVSSISFAQDDEEANYEGTKKVTMLRGADVPASKRSTVSDIIGFDERGFYAIKTSVSLLSYSSEIQFYDKNYSLVAEEEFEPEVNGKDSYVERIIFWNNELFVFHSYADKKTDENTLYLQKVDKKSLKLESQITEIASINFSGKTRRNSGNYNVIVSDDSSKLLVYYQLPYDKGEPEQFGFHAFDSKMNKLWSKDVTLPYEEELFSVADYTIGNDGNVYLTGRLYNDRAKIKVKGEVNYSYKVLSYKNDGNDFQEYALDLGDKFITDVRIGTFPNGDLACAGFYSDKGVYSIKGSFYLRIEGNSGKALQTTTNQFGIDFITQNLTEKQEKKAKKKEEKGKSLELYEYDLDNLIMRSDGGVVLVGEQYYVRVVTTTTTTANGGTTTRTTYHYYYNDIIVVNISPEGQIEWAKKVAKRQHTVNDNGYFSSYATMVHGDKLYFVFNDHSMNLNYDGTGKIYWMNLGKKSMVTLVEVNAAGDITREALFSMQDAGVRTRPKVCEQISADKMILFGEKGKLHRFTELTFH